MNSTPVTYASRIGNMRTGLADFRGGQVRHEEKQQSVCRNVEIEIDEAVREKPQARDETRELDGRSKGPYRLRQAPKRIEQQNAQKPNTAQAAGNARFRETLEVVIVGVIDDFSVIESLVSREDQLESAETGARPGMVQENVPGVGAHGGAFSNRHFQGLHGRKPFDELLDAKPGDHEKGKEQDGATGEQMLSESAAKNHPKEQDTQFHKEANDSSTRCGKNQGTDRNNGKETDKEPSFATDLSKHQRHQGNRNDELSKTREMVAIHVGPEGNAPKRISRNQ